MAYADSIRSGSPTFENVASLVEGIFSSLFGLTFSSWTPSYTCSGSMTYTSVSVTYAKYIRCGKWVIGFFYVSGTVGGTPARVIGLSYPVTAAASTPGGGAAFVKDGGNELGATLSLSTNINVTRYDAANFSAGSGRVLAGFFCYEAA